MPSFKIKNSSTNKILISVGRLSDEAEDSTRVSDYVMEPNETYIDASLGQQSGIRKLLIKTGDEDIWWSGVVPSNGNHQVEIDMNNRKVTYNNDTLVNTYQSGNTSRWWYVAVVIVVLLTIMAYMYYRKKSK